MKKKSIALSTTIASWTLKLSLSLSIIFSLANVVVAEIKEAEIEKRKVEEDQVTLRVQVRKEENRPALNLQEENFQVLVDGEPIDKLDKWRNPEETKPSPARMIVLLDMSGSMRGPDKRGSSKLKGAINAIGELINVAEERGGDTQIAIVPFGVSSNSGCKLVYSVDNKSLDNFFPAGDLLLEQQLKSYLDQEQKICASTDLYNPPIKAVEFLGRKYPLPDPDLPEEKAPPPPPKLAVVLLSDGFHTEGNETEDFRELEEELKQYSHIQVHTLGYGLTAEQLGRKYKCDGKPATRADVGVGRCKVPEEEFVDQKRLKEIADLTEGIASFSADPQDIAKALKEFLNALQGQYELVYDSPKPQRGKKYQVQVVVREGNSTVESNFAYYRVIWQPLSFKTRFIIFISVLLLLGVGGGLPFWFWGQSFNNEQ